MDVGEIVGGENALKFYEKGMNISEMLWAEFGMKMVLRGLQLHNPERTYSNK